MELVVGLGDAVHSPVPLGNDKGLIGEARNDLKGMTESRAPFACNVGCGGAIHSNKGQVFAVAVHDPWLRKEVLPPEIEMVGRVIRIESHGLRPVIHI